jgi:hypothetical protein
LRTFRDLLIQRHVHKRLFLTNNIAVGTATVGIDMVTVLGSSSVQQHSKNRVLHAFLLLGAHSTDRPQKEGKLKQYYASG